MCLPTIAYSIFLMLLVVDKFCFMQPIAISQQTPLTTTTSSGVLSNIEDPSESETTSSESSGEEDQYHCFKCYNQITEAQRMIAILEHLKDKEAKHIRQRASSLSSQNRKLKQSIPKNSRNQTNSAPTFRSSTFLDEKNSDTVTENKPIVVSRLRVARSTSSGGFGIPSLESIKNSPKNNFDSELKKLKLKQEQQFNKTCKVLYEVKQCLDELSSTCLGNLQFHSMEVYLRQWEMRLTCPPKSDTNAKIFWQLTRTLPVIEERPKEPIARPLSNPEEVRHRLNIMLSRNTSPFGVMLKPTLTNTASHRFESLRPTEQQHSIGQSKGISKDVFTYHQAPIVGQLLILIPCFALAVIILITISIRYFKTARKI